MTQALPLPNALAAAAPAAAAATARRRIVFLGTAHDNGGSSILAGALAQAMRAAGHDVEEWYLFGSAAAVAGPVRVLHDGARSRSPFLLARLFARVVKDLAARRADAVFGLQSLSNLMAGFGGALAGVRHRIATHHNPAPMLNRALMALDALAGRCGAYTRMVACAREVGASYARPGSAYARKLTVIANGQQPPRPMPRAQARAALGLPADGVVIGQIGRLCAQKNQSFTLDRLAEWPDATLLMVGCGPDEAMLRDAIRARGLDRRVRQIAALDHARIGEFYSAVDLVLFPSRFEGLSLAAIEALHAGTPMLCADIASFREMFEAAPGLRQEIVLPLDAPDRWTARGREIVGNAALRAQLAVDYARLAPAFSFDAMARRYLALVD